MQRRNFLGGLAGILAAGSAPAIIHDAMKIFVPKQMSLEELTIADLRAMGKRIRTYVDPYANEMDVSSRRRYQTVDTSRGFHLYEIPLVPVGAGKHLPILVPPERRVLRFA